MHNSTTIYRFFPFYLHIAVISMVILNLPFLFLFCILIIVYTQYMEIPLIHWTWINSMQTGLCRVNIPHAKKVTQQSKDLIWLQLANKLEFECLYMSNRFVAQIGTNSNVNEVIQFYQFFLSFRQSGQTYLKLFD